MLQCEIKLHQNNTTLTQSNFSHNLLVSKYKHNKRDIMYKIYIYKMLTTLLLVANKMDDINTLKYTHIWMCIKMQCTPLH